ncbi:MAG: hypothetical protein J3Q66DRAFT_322062 [Benniella sp.]|nr:MAG: hypothetical protein J3Q66DRAFT_322062 [Benniella sp.]
MPKTSSKRKKEKNADFKKTKLKVGKKKAVADNFTDTSFKSKAISLPSQSISHDKTALLTNARNVTFAELMTQLKHYSPNTRKEALLGLRDLFHRHPHLLPLHLGTLVNAVVRLLIDDSSIVRKALQSFLGEFIPTLHPRDVHPFLPLLVVYTCSAMTHILEDIREDALKFMDLWVAAGGQIVVNGFWDKIIPNYVSLLTSDSNATNASKFSSAMSFSASTSNGVAGSGSGPSTSKTVAGASTGKNAPGSLKAKSEVLGSLAGFLQEGLGGEGGEKDPYWFMRNFLGTAHARKSFNTSRARLVGSEEPTGKRKRKTSGHSAATTSSNRSTRRRKVDESDGSDGQEEDEDGDENEENDEDEQGTDSDASDEASHSDYSTDIEDASSLAFDASPVVSLNRAKRHRQCLEAFPLHPSAVRSSVAQTIFGHAQSLGIDATDSGSIHIKIFPQQGGAAVTGSGTGASVGASGSRTTEGANLGGVQGRLSQIKPLITTLHPLLLSVWLDTAPTVFASTTTIHAGHALNIVHLVLRIWGILWRAALARPKKKNVDSEEEQELEKEEAKWLEEYLQSLLRHVLIYFPFGKDTVGMVDSKVSALLQEMNTIYCELTSLFMLGSGIGRVRRVHKDSLKVSSTVQEVLEPKAKKALKTSYRPSNKNAKRKVVVKQESSSSSDYDSDEEQGEAGAVKNDNMVTIQVETPAWADQVVDFVLAALGWVGPEAHGGDGEGSTRMSGLSSDFKAQHLAALLPTLWTLLNCLESKRKEWVFEALVTFFDTAHVQSTSKRIVLQFLSLAIKLQSHPHYTGSFSILVPGGRTEAVQRSLKGLPKTKREEQRTSIAKMSKLLASSLLKLPKLLWDLGVERTETSETILDLLVWVTTIAGEGHAGATNEEGREQFLKTLQSYMALFFCVTVGDKNGKDGKRKVMGPFVKLPAYLQRRAVEMVFYSGVVCPDQIKKDAQASKQSSPLLAAVQSCCQVGDLSDEIRLYIQETLKISAKVM